MTVLIGVATVAFVLISVYGYITYKMAEQDHKISTMLGIISSMAQEQEYFRSKLLGGSPPLHSKINDNKQSSEISPFNLNDRIQVSDGEEDEHEDTSDDEDVESGDSDSDDDDDESRDGNDKIQILESHSISGSPSTKILNIHLTNNDDENNDENNDEVSDDESLESLGSSSDASSKSSCKDNNQLPKLKLKLNLLQENIKTIHLDDSISIPESNISEINLNLQNDDIIRVPPYTNRVQIMGEIKTPGIFELKNQANLGS